MAAHLGLGKCLVCGAKVPLKVEGNGWRVFYRCNGHTDRTACGSEMKYGQADSAELIAKAKEAEDADEGKVSANDKSGRVDPPAAPKPKRKPERRGSNFLSDL
ncbi:hypothetical protein [Parvibaculum sp.]|uniref:hypothetical protein n=1 Tax=Parvibaculum sp. TaxID=2024848 RepID=UPI001DA4FDA7|nr:hypothetical protein [Parvibaculum sp.]MBX3487862.1 hypothetical protein [Parvibaculum sp.]